MKFDFKRLFTGWISNFGRQRLREDRYPLDLRGAPDLRNYTDSLDYYKAMYEQHLLALQEKQVDSAARLAYRKRVHATWGIIAKGLEGVPYALSLLKHTIPEAREDGAAILSRLGKDAQVVAKLLESLQTESDITAKDTMILALGQLKSRMAIPALAAIIQNESADGDTRRTAVESLGLIVRKQFLKEDDPIATALKWLAGSSVEP